MEKLFENNGKQTRHTLDEEGNFVCKSFLIGNNQSILEILRKNFRTKRVEQKDFKYIFII